MRLPTGHLPRLTGWIANCGRLACSGPTVAAYRRRYPWRLSDVGSPMPPLQSRANRRLGGRDLAGERPIHTIRRALYCAKCEKGHGKKRRPDLIGLRLRKEPDPASPAAALQ
jgi:hypothetical protein